MKKIRFFFFVTLLLVIMLVSFLSGVEKGVVFAHPGSLDDYGGHHDYDNVS